MNLTLLSDRVLVKPNPKEKRTAGGLYIPDQAQETPCEGVVFAVGLGNIDTQMIVKNGDAVIYSCMAGTEINIEGVDYLLMRQNDIWAIIGK